MISRIQQFHFTKTRFFVSLLLLLLAVGVGGIFFITYLVDTAKKSVIDDGNNASLIITLHLTNEVKKMESIAQVLAGSSQMVRALLSSHPAAIEQANKTLDRYQSAAGASVCYLMNKEGLTIATSNRKDRHSFVGQYYRFRPYFQQALAGSRGFYYGLGATSGQCGFYISYPVRDMADRVIGVVAIKKVLEDLGNNLQQYRWFLIDRRGIILASSNPETRLKTLWRLDSAIENQLLVTGQFGAGPFEPVFKEPILDKAEVMMGNNRYLVTEYVTEYDGLSVILLWPTKQMAVYRTFGIILTLSIGFLLIGFLITIFILKRSADKLHDSERHLYDIINFLPDATMAIDVNKRITIWNHAIEEMTGVSAKEMIGKGDYAYMIPFYGVARPQLMDLCWDPNHEIAASYPYLSREGDNLMAEVFCNGLYGGKGAYVWIKVAPLRDAGGRLVGAIQSIRDVTNLKRSEEERQRLRERLVRAEKMESLGTLAGGVAHDLNNVLGVLVGYSELLQDKIPRESPLRRYVNNILQSGLRGAAIIQDLLTLARRGVAASEVVNLNRIVTDYLLTPEFEKLRSTYPRVIFKNDLEENLLNIKGSPIHLAKTVMNLVSNAAEAMTDSGDVLIRTENRYLDTPVRGYDDLQAGDYAVVTVSDNGKGIPAQDIGKIFEPFYTKKVMGRSGTGLGLAVVWGTVKDHGGYIDVQSEEGNGSVFSLYFPVTREAPAALPEIMTSAAYMGRGESILVVDDVVEQRELAVNMLERLGYRVTAVAGGEEAVHYLRKEKADLVILDMIMDPGIDGLETYRRIVDMHPKQRAVIVSGFFGNGTGKAGPGFGRGCLYPEALCDGNDRGGREKGTGQEQQLNHAFGQNPFYRGRILNFTV